MRDPVGDAPHEKAPQPADSSAQPLVAYDYEPGDYLLAQAQDLLVRLADAQVGPGYLPAGLLYLLDLSVQRPLGLAPDLLVGPHRGVGPAVWGG